MKKLFATLLSLSLILGPMPAAHASGGGIAKQILGISNSIVGATIITKCMMATTQPSLLVYMAGGIVYVAAEISGGNKQKKQEEKQAKNLDNLKANMTEGGDYQKGALQAQLNDEKDKLEVIQGRRKWMMATKAIYATATALAIVELILSKTPPVFKSDAGGCSSNPPTNLPLVTAIGLAFSGISAYASGGVMGVAGAAAAAGIDFVFELGIGAAITDMTVNVLNTSIGRIAIFAAATALVMVVDGELAKEESSTKKRIADLEKVNNQFNEDTAVDTKLAEGSSTSNGSGGGASSAAANSSKRELKSLAAVEQPNKKECFSSDKSGTQYGEASCSNPIKLTRPNLNPQFTVPTLVAASNTAADLGNAIASGDMKSAEVEASKIAAMAGRIDAVKDSMMKKLNDQLKAEGKKPISIEDTLSTQLSAFNKELNKQKPGSGNYTMEDLGFGKGSNGGSAATSPDLASAASKKSEEIGSGEAVSGDGVAGSNADFSNLAADAEAAADAAAAAEAGLNADPFGDGNNPFGSGNQFATDLSSSSRGMNGADAGNDISTERDRSIFKQVSQRYLLNYTKFFERKSINPPLTDAQAAQ